MVAGIGWLLILPCAFLIFLLYLPVVPNFRLYAHSLFPNYSPWPLLIATAALLLALVAHRMNRTPGTVILIFVATLTSVGAAIAFGQLLYVAQSNGASIRLLSTLEVRDFGADAAPDKSYAYAERDGQTLMLDYYRPKGPPPRGGWPVLVAIHGGGFVGGSRTIGAANMRWFADQGIALVSVDYRLAGPGHPTWDIATGDVECALAWTADHARALNIDIGRITLSGGSAGGNLAMNVGYAGKGRHTDPRCAARVPAIALVVAKAPIIDLVKAWNFPGELNGMNRSFLGRYIGGSPKDHPARFASANPTRLVGKGAPPALIMGGAADPLVPESGAVAFAAHAQAIGVSVRNIAFPHSGHDFNSNYGSVTNQAVRQIIVQFMDAHGQRKPR